MYLRDPNQWTISGQLTFVGEAVGQESTDGERTNDDDR